jgi:hypothetical protein
MSKENKDTSAEQAEKSGIRMAQVAAAALAAVTAALLGSTLGVAGTVLGAGVASVVTTVGAELYLRSMRRTRAAAQRARELARALTVPGSRHERVARNFSEQPTVRLPKPGTEAPGAGDEPTSKLRKLRWPLIIGTSVAAFIIAIAVITGFEGATGNTFGGGNGTTIGRLVASGSGLPGKKTQQPPTTQNSTPSATTQAPTSSPTPTATSTPNTTSPTSPTRAPATTGSASPTPSSAPQSPSGAPTPTPSAGATTPS